MGPVETLSRVAMSCGPSSFVLTCDETPSSLWISYTGVATGLATAAVITVLFVWFAQFVLLLWSSTAAAVAVFFCFFVVDGLAQMALLVSECLQNWDLKVRLR